MEGVTIRPWDTRPTGEDAMEPSEIDVHDGAWAVIIGTNAKPAGWIDTHELFAHQLYQDQILPTEAACAWPNCTCADSAKCSDASILPAAGEVPDDVRSFVYAILGADTWLEAGAIWNGNPEQRKAAHGFFGEPKP